MAAGQQFLFAPETPLVQRLGKDFFRKIPPRAGVYKMHDALGRIVYVGKARNLRQRLRSYRVANPERLGRRHLRLLQSVTRIEFDFCANEAAALKHEAKLIRECKPKFNRAGVWQGKPQFLAWRFVDQAVEFSVHETPLAGWERFGSLGAYAPRLRELIVRVFWLLANPGRGLHQLPHGWMQNRLPATVRLEFGERVGAIRAALAHAFWGSLTLFFQWLERELATGRPAFERTALAQDLEGLREFFAQSKMSTLRSCQMVLL